MMWLVRSITGKEVHLRSQDEYMNGDVRLRTYFIFNSTGIYFNLLAESLTINFTGTYMCGLDLDGRLYHDHMNITVQGQRRSILFKSVNVAINKGFSCMLDILKSAKFAKRSRILQNWKNFIPPIFRSPIRDGRYHNDEWHSRRK